MKITLEFGNYEEMEAYCAAIVARKETQIVPKEKPAEEKPKKAAAKKEEPAPEPEEEPVKAEKKPAKEEKADGRSEAEVRVLVMGKLKSGKKEEVKELFAKWGGEKLSEILEKNPDSFDEIYADAEAI